MVFLATSHIDVPTDTGFFTMVVDKSHEVTPTCQLYEGRVLALGQANDGDTVWVPQIAGILGEGIQKTDYIGLQEVDEGFEAEFLNAISDGETEESAINIANDAATVFGEELTKELNVR